MNDPISSRELSVEHQRLIAVMQTAKPPPADADTPVIPDELLRRLREQYGQASAPISMMRLVEKEDGDATESAPARSTTFWSRLNKTWHSSAGIALAASIVLLCVAVSIILPKQQHDEDLVRGQTIAAPQVKTYWVAINGKPPPPTGVGMPKFIVVSPPAPQLMTKEPAIILDPVRREAYISDDQSTPRNSIQINDPDDDGEWLTAQRQLSKLLKP